MCIVAQGAKFASFGDARYEYREGEALIVGIDTPSMGDTGNCDSYCLLASKACTLAASPTSNFTTSFPGGQADCISQCIKLSGAGPSLPYSVSPTLPKGNNLQCRLLHVSRALTTPVECAAALGAAPCQ